MEIRHATLADVPHISALRRNLTGKHIAHEFSREAAIRSYLASGYRYHVAEENGELTDVVAIWDNRHLYHLFVAERFQGNGLARALWQTAKAASLEAGNPGVFTVNFSRCAVGLYENRICRARRSDR